MDKSLSFLVLNAKLKFQTNHVVSTFSLPECHDFSCPLKFSNSSVPLVFPHFPFRPIECKNPVNLTSDIITLFLCVLCFLFLLNQYNHYYTSAVCSCLLSSLRLSNVKPDPGFIYTYSSYFYNA